MSRRMGQRAMGQRGSTTFFGIGLMVMLLFVGGFSLDLWRVYGERRALAEMADAAAAAGANGVDAGAYRVGDEIRLDPGLAEALAWENLAAQVDHGSLAGQPGVVATPELVMVSLDGEVEMTLLSAFTGGGSFSFTVLAESGPIQN